MSQNSSPMARPSQKSARKTTTARKQPTLSGFPVDPLPKGFVSANSMFPSKATQIHKNSKSDVVPTKINPRRSKKAFKVFEDEPSDQRTEQREHVEGSGLTEAFGAASIHRNAGGYPSQGGKGSPRTALENLYRSKLHKAGRSSENISIELLIEENEYKDSKQDEDTASKANTQSHEGHGTTPPPYQSPASFEELLSEATLLPHAVHLPKVSTSASIPSTVPSSNIPAQKSALTAAIIAAHAAKPKGQRVPPLERVWKLETFKGKTSREPMEEFVRLCGRDPEQERFKVLNCEELAEYVRGWQLVYKEDKEATDIGTKSRKVKKAAPGGVPEDVTRTNPVANPSLVGASKKRGLQAVDTAEEGIATSSKRTRY